MKASLLTESEMEAEVARRLESGEWWLVLARPFGDLLPTIEHRYYPPSTPANDDFELMIGRDIIYAWCRRRRMTARQLIECSAHLDPDFPPLTDAQFAELEKSGIVVAGKELGAEAKRMGMDVQNP